MTARRSGFQIWGCRVGSRALKGAYRAALAAYRTAKAEAERYIEHPNGCISTKRYFSYSVIIIGIIAQCAASVFTTGSNRMKRISTLVVIGGTALSIIGCVGIYLAYLTMTTTIKPQKVLPEIPGTFFAMLVITALMLIAAVLAMVLGKRSKKGDPVTMPSKFQLSSSDSIMMAWAVDSFSFVKREAALPHSWI